MRLIREAREGGARLAPACRVVGLDVRTVQRWQTRGEDSEDRRQGPKTKPANALTSREKSEILRVVNLPPFRNLSPKQIVPQLADRGRYLASESTMERVLREHGQTTHRGPKRPRRVLKPREKRATGPCQVWSWDITYLRSPIAGRFFYLYMVIDVWSRMIVAAQVYSRECGDIASAFLQDAVTGQEISDSLILHQDNGSPMKGTLKACMEHLGVAMSYSRPRTSDDNPFSESLFGTMKTRPEYPRKPFASLEDAQAWVEAFVHWYNEEHLHSAIGFVTPGQRHRGEAEAVLAKRRQVYAKARQKKPERWPGKARPWTAPDEVFLNPDKATLEKMRR